MIQIKRGRGMTLIEALVALAVFMLLVTVFYKIFSQSATHLADSKKRRAAVALANERMEHYRNFAYVNVEVQTKGGNIVADENATINGITFRIITSVNLIDDPLDGTVLAGTDLIWNDYKRVSVSVVWDKCINSAISRGDAEFGGECSSKRVRMVSQFVPPGGLEVSPSGGVLAVNVLDEDANIVSGAHVSIHNSQNGQTPYQNEPVDANGGLLYIGAPACDSCYEISVEANDYEVIKTESMPATINTSKGQVSYHPRYLHQSVEDGVLTTVSFIVKKKSELNIVAEDPLSKNSYAGIGFSVRGGRVLGTNLNDNPLYTEQDLYILNQNLTTGSDGKLKIRTDTNSDGSVTSADKTNQGLFTFLDIDLDTDNDGTDDYVFWKMNPGVDTNSAQISLDSNATVNARMVLVDKKYESVFFTIVDSDGKPVEGASVRLYDQKDPHVYDVVQLTDVYGHAYFPTRGENAPHDVVELIAGDSYNVAVAADGFDPKVYEDGDAVDVVDDKLLEMEVILSPI